MRFQLLGTCDPTATIVAVMIYGAQLKYTQLGLRSLNGGGGGGVWFYVMGNW
jgi:hypothetical protein